MKSGDAEIWMLASTIVFSQLLVRVFQSKTTALFILIPAILIIYIMLKKEEKHEIATRQ